MRPADYVTAGLVLAAIACALIAIGHGSNDLLVIAGAVVGVVAATALLAGGVGLGVMAAARERERS